MVESYDDTPSAEDAAFVSRIAAHLRAPESAHPSFEKRLMDKVRFEGASLYPRASSSANLAWWRKEWVIRLSPRVGIAIAAGISAIIALSAVAVGSRIAASSQPSAITQTRPARDTVQLVRFVFVDSGASSVALVGDFNEWTRGATELKPSGAPGVWSVSVALTPGRHEYAFIVNGTRWVADPLAVKSSDDFGTESSVIRVGTAGKRET